MCTDQNWIQLKAVNIQTLREENEEEMTHKLQATPHLCFLKMWEVFLSNCWRGRLQRTQSTEKGSLASSEKSNSIQWMIECFLLWAQFLHDTWFGEQLIPLINTTADAIKENQVIFLCIRNVFSYFHNWNLAEWKQLWGFWNVKMCLTRLWCWKILD